MRRLRGLAERSATLESHVGALARVNEHTARGLIASGAVYVDGRRRQEPTLVVSAGKTVMVVLEESGRSAQTPSTPAPALRILHEDERLIAVDKPAGIAAQPTPSRTGESLLDLVTAHLGRAAGLVHRLDKETSGVTVFGKTAATTSALAEAFRTRTTRKTYVAIVGAGIDDRGTIELPLSKDPSRPGRWRASRRHQGLDAFTAFTTLGRADGTALLQLEPRTGRTHQLRAHLTGIGFPIVGDRLYGGAEGPRCLLHAWRLEVLGHTFQAPLPTDFPAFASALTPHT